MKKTLFVVALAALAPTFAWAQGTTGKFYVDWDNAAKKCVVVEKRPTNPTLADLPPYNSRAEAETGLKTVNGCETGQPMRK
jgi:hypothetical protein